MVVKAVPSGIQADVYQAYAWVADNRLTMKR